MASQTVSQITPQKEIEKSKVDAFLEKAVSDFGAAVSAALVVVGDKLGLYKAMAGAAPMNSAELAARTGTHERYIREWLINQAAGGYIEYDPASGKYTMTDEHAAALADDQSPFFVGGGFQVITAMIKADERITKAFRTGQGMFWGEHHQDLFEGTERFFRPGYAAHLVSDWIPALDGVKPRLEAGALVADIGCGYGASTIIMAKAFPKSRFYGFDNHAPSIVHARSEAFHSGVASSAFFDIAGATNFPNAGGYDFIAFFDCLHDLGDPVGSLKRARETLNNDGVVMVVEPMAAETVEGNLNPIGRVYSGASVLCCTPNAIASGQTALGTLAREKDLRQVARQAGFSRFRKACETPMNRVFEVRP
ncbi:MAG: methyltransferase domain-containing protein [Acidobacteria bacterium]|nr:methyltransferase domain-containing protein [Acidobacteriota bacterium]